MPDEAIICENCMEEIDVGDGHWDVVCPRCGYCENCGGDDFEHYEECGHAG